MGAANLDERVGPLLRTVSHADPAENRETLRIRLADLIVRHAVVLPDDVRRAVLASLALLPEARFRFLRDRQKWALGPMNRDSLRTVDRTAERGLRRIAEEIIREFAESQERPSNPFAPRGFYTAELTATSRLDVAPSEWWERREIVALEQGFDRVPVSVSVPAAPDGSYAEVELVVNRGGTLLEWSRPQPSHYQGWIRLERRLACMEHYEYEIRRRTLHGGAVQPYYIVSANVRCDRLLVHVHLGSIEKAWKVDGVPWPTLEDGTVKYAPPLPAEASGVVSAEFTHLHRGLAYGIVWDAG